MEYGVLQSDFPFILDKGFTGDTSNQKQSTGMGLFLVKKLCDDLQVEIEVESKDKRGFTIQPAVSEGLKRAFENVINV